MADDEQRTDSLEPSDDASSSTFARLAAEARNMLPIIRRTEPKDITSLFTEHASALPPGHLIKDDFFTLFEAVGALEIMDPKMDSGFIPEGDSFDADFDVEADLDFGQVLWIMDQLLCLQIEWLEGYPLSQTVFTSLHISRLLEPSNREAVFSNATKAGNTETSEAYITHHMLRAYCIAVIKSVERCTGLIQDQTYYEEEDFVTHTFGRDLIPSYTETSVRVLLADVGEILDDEAPSLTQDQRGALADRMLFQYNMLEALRGQHYTWELLHDTLRNMGKNHSIATPMPEAFSSKVQRQLATSTPPRPMLNVTWDEAMTKWHRLIDDAVEACHLSLLDPVTDPQALQHMVWAFAARTPPPTTLPRALLQDQLFNDLGPIATGVGHYELFLADLRNTVLAGDSLVDPASFQVELPSDSRHLRARLIESFAEKAFDEYLNLYRMVCQNRCRIRRLFTQAIVIWDTLESEAAKIDQAIANVAFTGKGKDRLQKDLMPLSTWVKFYKLRIMAWTIQMGFETDIFMDDELGVMCWYLRYLSHKQSRLIAHIDHHLTARVPRASAAATDDCITSQAYLHSTQTLSDATQMMASALSMLCFRLQALDIITSPKREFSTPQLFYEARLKPYLGVANDRIPTLADFDAARQADADKPTHEVCQLIDTKIKRAKALLGEFRNIGLQAGKYEGAEEYFAREVKALETTCVGVAVNAAQLGRLVGKFGEGEGGVGGSVECEMVRKWHGWWVVPVVRERKAAG